MYETALMKTMWIILTETDRKAQMSKKYTQYYRKNCIFKEYLKVIDLKKKLLVVYHTNKMLVVFSNGEISVIVLSSKNYVLRNCLFSPLFLN